MKIKLLSIIAIVAVVFIAAVLWRVDGFVFGDRMSWAEAQGRSQLMGVHQALGIELLSLERLVYSFNSENFRKEKMNWNALSPYYAVASLAIGPQGEVSTQTLLTKERSSASNWNPDFFNKALVKVDTKIISRGMQIFVKPFQDGNRGRHVALVFINQSKAFALVGGGEIFQSLIDAQKGSISSFSIVTTAGITAGHSVPEYVGTLLTEDPVFKVARLSGALQGSGIYDDGRGQKIFGLYDQMAGSNILILSSASVKDLMKGRGPLLWQFVFLGLGLVLVGVAGVLVVVNPHEKSLDYLRDHAKAMVAGRREFPPVQLTSEVKEIDDMLRAVPIGAATVGTALPAVSQSGPSDQMETKMLIYQGVASALGHELRGPLTSILGYSQMVLGHTQDPTIVENVNSILRESRSARQVLEKLFSFAGENELEKNTMSLEVPIERALKKLEAKLVQKGVQVHKDFSTAVTLPISAEELTRALENIFLNSIEAMDRIANKSLNIELSEVDDGLKLNISDTGEGVEPQNIHKIFDPFFTTRSFQNHTGLGLTVAMGILREHGAEVKVKSEPSKGLNIEILFKEKNVISTSQVLKAREARSEDSEEMFIEQNFVAPTPPAALLKEAQEQAAQQLEADLKSNISPTSINIDTLLDLPPMVDDELTFIDENESKEFAAVTAPNAKEAPPMAAPKVLPPQMNRPPLKKSKLDEFVVEIPKPSGKRS